MESFFEGVYTAVGILLPFTWGFVAGWACKSCAKV